MGGNQLYKQVLIADFEHAPSQKQINCWKAACLNGITPNSVAFLSTPLHSKSCWRCWLRIALNTFQWFVVQLSWLDCHLFGLQKFNAMTAKQIGNAAYALFYQFAGQSDSQHNFSPSSNKVCGALVAFIST